MSSISIVMIGFVVLALGLLFGASRIARLIMPDRDPGALTRMIQVAALVILVLSLLLFPRSPESTAFPPPPEGPPGVNR